MILGPPVAMIFIFLATTALVFVLSLLGLNPKFSHQFIGILSVCGGEISAVTLVQELKGAIIIANKI